MVRIHFPPQVKEIRRTAMSTGPMHDSRRGLAGYYRYQARKIGAHMNPPDPTTRLMQDPKQPASRLRTVNIHHTAAIEKTFPNGRARRPPCANYYRCCCFRR